MRGRKAFHAPEGYFTVGQVAAAAGVALGTVREDCRRGALAAEHVTDPVYKIPVWIIKREVAIKYVWERGLEDSKEFWTSARLAKALFVSRAAVDHWVSDGVLTGLVVNPAYTRGSQVKYLIPEAIARKVVELYGTSAQPQQIRLALR